MSGRDERDWCLYDEVYDESVHDWLNERVADPPPSPDEYLEGEALRRERARLLAPEPMPPQSPDEARPET